MKGWPTKKLGELARIRRGASPRPKGDPRYFGGDIPWLKIGDVPPGSRFVSQTEEGVTPAGRDLSVYVEPGTLLLSNSASVGRPVVTKVGACIHDGWLAIDGYEAELRQDFLYWCLIWSHSHFQRLAPSGTQRNLNIGLVTGFEVPVPPLVEQERIAKLLDEADGLRKLRVHADHRTAELLPALSHEMFGGPDPGRKTMTLEDAVERFIDYRGKTPQKSLSGVPLVTARIVKGGRILPAHEFIQEEIYDDWMRRGLPKVGDVLFTMEAPLGEVAIVHDARIALAQRILLMRPRADLLDSRYFMSALKFPVVWKQIEERANSTTVRGIRQAELRKVQIPVPPLPLQKEFAKLVTEIRGLEAEQASSGRRLEGLFQSLLHRAFRGEL